MSHKCSAQKPDGTDCGARPLVGSQFCFFHDPECSARRKAASAAGGRARKPPLPTDAPSIPVRTLADIRNLNELLLTMLLNVEIDWHIANSAGQLVNILLGALEVEALEGRVLNLESLRKGGKPVETVSGAAVAVDSTLIVLRTAADIISLLERLINMLLKGQIDYRPANSASSLANSLLRVLSVELDKRIANLKASEESTGRPQ
jgi:hypothetical protein